MAASRNLLALALSTSLLFVTSLGCDSPKPDAETPSATPPAASKAPDAPPKETAKKEEPKDDFCATLLTTFTTKDKQYYYIVIKDPCVKMDANYNTNIDPYLKEFRAEIAKTPGFDPSANVGLMPRVITSEEELKTAISKIKGEPKELVLNVKK